MMDFQAARYLVDGVVPGQAGDDHPYSTPMGVFEPSNGFINNGVGGDGQWRALCVALDRPDLGCMAAYATGYASDSKACRPGPSTKSMRFSPIRR